MQAAPAPAPDPAVTPEATPVAAQFDRRHLPAVARVSPELTTWFLRRQFTFWQVAQQGVHPDAARSFDDLGEATKRFICSLIPVQFEVFQCLGKENVTKLREAAIAGNRSSVENLLHLHFIAYHEGWWRCRNLLIAAGIDLGQAPRDDFKPASQLSEAKIEEGKRIAWGLALTLGDMDETRWAEFGKIFED